MKRCRPGQPAWHRGWGGGSKKDGGGAGRRYAAVAAWFAQMKTKDEKGLAILFLI